MKSNVSAAGKSGKVLILEQVERDNQASLRHSAGQALCWLSGRMTEGLVFISFFSFLLRMISQGPPAA